MSTEKSIFAERFEILHRLGRGGMARVFLAEMMWDKGASRRVALKLFDVDADDTGQGTGQEDEARLGGLLDHPNIVQVLEYGEYQQQPYMAMEYVQGLTLAQLIRRHVELGQLIPLDMALLIVSQICDGLEYAHHEATDKNGHPLEIVHRDIKPSNLLISRHGVVKIADFGVARANSNVHRTADPRLMKGTTRYLPPEGVGAFPNVRPDHRADLFSLGAVLFELLTLQPLYPAEQIAELYGQAMSCQYGDLEQRLPESKARPHLAQLLQTALAPYPDQRFQSAREFKQAIQAQEARIGAATPATLRDWLASPALAPSDGPGQGSVPSGGRPFGGSQPTRRLGSSPGPRAPTPVPEPLELDPSVVAQGGGPAASLTSSAAATPTRRSNQAILLPPREPTPRPPVPQGQTIELPVRPNTPVMGLVPPSPTPANQARWQPTARPAPPQAAPPRAQEPPPAPPSRLGVVALSLLGLVVGLGLSLGGWWVLTQPFPLAVSPAGAQVSVNGGPPTPLAELGRYPRWREHRLTISMEGHESVVLTLPAWSSFDQSGLTIHLEPAAAGHPQRGGGASPGPNPSGAQE